MIYDPANNAKFRGLFGTGKVSALSIEKSPENDKVTLTPLHKDKKHPHCMIEIPINRLHEVIAALVKMGGEK